MCGVAQQEILLHHPIRRDEEEEGLLLGIEVSVSKRRYAGAGRIKGTIPEYWSWQSLPVGSNLVLCEEVVLDCRIAVYSIERANIAACEVQILHNQKQ